jgi:biofilm PGA synthesis N-glycosyltransferase PgaC
MMALFIGILAVVVVVQALFWILCAHQLDRQSGIFPKENLDVSLIICARNEADNLLNNLPYFLNQKGVNLEVIVVDDHSTDQSISILEELAINHPKLRIIQMESKHHPGKKDALLKGILSAQHDIIILADADCYPASDRWAALMSAPIADGYSIVAGYSPILAEKTFVNSYSRYENVITALQYIGLGRLGWPYMGVGRNLAYHKKALEEVGYFKEHTDVAAGDDDLTVQSILAKKGRRSIYFQTDIHSFVNTKGIRDAGQYVAQKTRHYSVSSRYPATIQYMLAGIHFSWLLFYIGLAICVAMHLWIAGFFLLIVHFVIRWLGWIKIQKSLRQGFSMVDWVGFDILYPWITLILTIFGLLKKQKAWKSF